MNFGNSMRKIKKAKHEQVWSKLSEHSDILILIVLIVYAGFTGDVSVIDISQCISVLVKYINMIK